MNTTDKFSFIYKTCIAVKDDVVRVTNVRSTVESMFTYNRGEFDRYIACVIPIEIRSKVDKRFLYRVTNQGQELWILQEHDSYIIYEEMPLALTYYLLRSNDLARDSQISVSFKTSRH